MRRPVPSIILRLLERRLPPRMFDVVAGDIEERWRRESPAAPLRAWIYLFRLTASLLWHTRPGTRRNSPDLHIPGGGHMLTGILQDIRFAVRLAARQPWLSAAAVGTLAIGVAASTAMFSVMHAWLLTPLPYRHAERLVIVWETIPSASIFENTPAPASLTAWQERGHTFEGLAAWTSGFVNLTGDAEPARLTAAVASSEVLPLLGVTPHLGRNFTAEESQPNGPAAVMLAFDTWTGRFGARADIIGQQVTLSGQSTTVVGVLPRHVQLLHFVADVWQPLRMTAAERASESRMLWVVGRLGESVTAAQAGAEVDAIMRERSEGRLGARVVAFQEQMLGSLTRDVPLLFGAAAFVLLIACANVVSLTLARIAGRHDELVVREALGASRARLLRQMLTESVALGLLAGGAGLLLASWAVRAVVALAPEADRMPIVTVASPAVITFALVAATITVAAFSVVAAWHAVRASDRRVMQAGGRRITGARQPLLRAVVVGEVALALALLTGATLVARSYQALSGVELGFDPRGVIAFELWRPSAASLEASTAFYDGVLEELGATAGIRSAGLTQALPLRSSAMGAGFVVEGSEAGAGSVLAYWRVVSPGFLDTLAIPLVAGRHFDARDREGGERTAIVTAAFASRAWPGGDALGRRIGWGSFDEPITVVGVAGDIRVSPAAAPGPHVYLPYHQSGGRLPHQLVVRSDLGSAATIDVVRRVVGAIDPLQPISGITSMEALQDQAMARRRFQLALVSIAAGIAVLLALVGIYGLLSYAGRQMSPELGLRLALGASRAGLLWHVMRIGLSPALLGVALGTTMAWWGASLLRGVLYDVDPRDPAMLATAAALLTAASLAACLVPAWRAARTDPLITMRSS